MITYLLVPTNNGCVCCYQILITSTVLKPTCLSEAETFTVSTIFSQTLTLRTLCYWDCIAVFCHSVMRMNCAQMADSFYKNLFTARGRTGTWVPSKTMIAKISATVILFHLKVSCLCPMQYFWLFFINCAKPSLFKQCVEAIIRLEAAWRQHLTSRPKQWTTHS